MTAETTVGGSRARPPRLLKWEEFATNRIHRHGHGRSRCTCKQQRERDPIHTITRQKCNEIVPKLLVSKDFPCRSLCRPNHAPGDSFWLLKAMLQPKSGFGVDLHRKGGLLAMDATPRRSGAPSSRRSARNARSASTVARERAAKTAPSYPLH